MDYKLIWSPQAIEDIEAIAEYIARDSTTYAESTVVHGKRIIEDLI
jgi:toxin ParE1/3/4